MQKCPTCYFTELTIESLLQNGECYKLQPVILYSLFNKGQSKENDNLIHVIIKYKISADDLDCL